MKLKLLGILLVTISLTACKDEKTQEKADAAPKAAVDDKLKVSFDLIIKKDDNLHLFYTEDGTINFDEKRSIWIPVKGSDAVQTVTYTIPEEILPTHLRADFGFGKNEAQSDVELKSFELEYMGKKFTAQGTDIFTYFYPNEQTTEIVPGTSTLKRKSKQQESGPILYPQIPLTEKIEELTQGASN